MPGKEKGAGRMRLVRILIALSAFTIAGMPQEHATPTWVPFPADHWPEEPDGFNGMKFDATPAESEKTIKLENCETIEHGNLSCKTTLTLAGKAFRGDILFTVPYNPKTGSPVGEGRLARISSEFDKADYAFVKAAFVKVYGQPHGTEEGGTLRWTGNKAEIRLNVGFFSISPNMVARGVIRKVTIEARLLPPSSAVKPPAYELYTETARIVIFFARFEASRAGSPVIDTEHLLLGLIREEKALPHELPWLDADIESLRNDIESQMTIREKISPLTDTPLSDDSKRALTYAVEEGKELQHNYIHPAHIILGLLRLETCAAATALQRQGINYTAYREVVRTSPLLPKFPHAQ